MSFPSSVLMNAAGVPVFSVYGVTASMIFCCNLSKSSVGYDNSGEANRWQGNVVILECLQFPTCGPLGGENLIESGIDFFKVRSSDKLLQHGDVRIMRCVESKALWKAFQQASIVGLCMLQHRRIGLQRDVDGGDGVLLS